jgi:hypothetical protein
MGLPDNVNGSTNSRGKTKNIFSRLFKSISTRNADANQQYENDAPKVKLVIRHRFPGIELVSPVYASDGAECPLPPDQRLDVDSTTRVDFNLNITQNESTGILMYELKTTTQSNQNVISSEDEVRCIQLAIIWKINNSKELCVVSYLIEHDKYHVWDRDELMKLVKRYQVFSVQYTPIEETYLIQDNTVLMTYLYITREGEGYKLDMTISEERIRDDTQRPWYIDVDR